MLEEPRVEKIDVDVFIISNKENETTRKMEEQRYLSGNKNMKGEHNENTIDYERLSM